MDIDYQQLRLDGIYRQDQTGRLMLRIKAPAGVLSSLQVEQLCTLAEDFAQGSLHLTSRCSIELHGLAHADLKTIFPRLDAVGLTSRGACGGAVRGISCSTTLGAHFDVAQLLARRLQRHFAGNPYFEGLPKKFKISVDGDYSRSRHLIQDVGLVYVGDDDGVECFDIWCAGGLGRAPQAGFLFEKAVASNRVIPLTESIVRVYAAHTPAGKRLKSLLNDIGEERFRTLVSTDGAAHSVPSLRPTVVGAALPSKHAIIEVGIFAGEINATRFSALAQLANSYCDGFLALTADQNIALPLVQADQRDAAQQALAAAGFSGETPAEQVTFRVCPGNHECRMGLSATRDVAAHVIHALDAAGRQQSWAISGCANSCSQPQLADFGIMTSNGEKNGAGTRTPRFDLYRRSSAGLGRVVAENLDLNELLRLVNTLPAVKL
ncbi:MAG: nitrite/sulfite reductase [Desulfuromonadales bacterium]|nr:nitrite/sulfite reductase [Desulfuromonadales bacterium]